MLQPRNAHNETRRAFEADVAAVRASDPTANRKPKSAAGAVAGADQSVEHAAADLTRNAGTVVVDDDRSEVAFGMHGDAYGRACMTDGVVEQIADDLCDAAFIGVGEDRSGLEVDVRRAGSDGIFASDARDGIADVDRLALELFRAPGACQEREIGNEARSVERSGGNRFECRTFRITRVDRSLLRYARYRSERRPQFVRDVGGEISFPLGGSLKRSD